MSDYDEPPPPPPPEESEEKHIRQLQPGQRSAADWKAYALKKLHPDLEEKMSMGVNTDFDLPPEVHDNQTQSEFGTTKEQTSATIVTTADIRELIPIPDDAHLTRCTASSIRAAEKDATDLLHHIQREIALQLQEAGVSYASSTLDNIEVAAQVGEKVEPRAKFAPRRQLEYHGAGKHNSSVMTPDKQETETDQFVKEMALGSHHPNNYYWRYAEQQKELQTHSDLFARRARAMDEARSQALRRHQLFDDIENSLRSQCTDLNKRLEAANELLAKSKEKDPTVAYGLDMRGRQAIKDARAAVDAAGAGVGRQQQYVPVHLTGMLPGTTPANPVNQGESSSLAALREYLVTAEPSSVGGGLGGGGRAPLGPGEMGSGPTILNPSLSGAPRPPSEIL